MSPLTSLYADISAWENGDESSGLPGPMLVRAKPNVRVEEVSHELLRKHVFVLPPHVHHVKQESRENQNEKHGKQVENEQIAEHDTPPNFLCAESIYD